MLDIERIREDSEKVKEAIKTKGVGPEVVDEFLKVDDEWREITTRTEELRAKQNKLGKDDRDEAKKLKDEIKILNDELKHLEKERDILLSEIPNIPNEDVPVGKDEDENVVVRTHGDKPEFDFELKDYVELAGDMIDTERAAKVSGSRFGYLLGDIVLLEYALVKLVFEKLSEHGFIPIVPPVLVKSEAMMKMGKAKFAEGDAFHLKEDDMYLVGTAEDAIGPMHMDETLQAKDLPLRYVGFSPAFRREAGSYGKDTKGILRVHQFDKIEMFSFTKPEDSKKEHEFLVQLQEEIMQDLGLPYQVVHICTGDMGFTAEDQFDIEAWIPSEEKYRETHSASNVTDFQARGLKIKYSTGKGSDFVHMLNATGLAIGRTLIAILENYQTSDGKIKVPEVLQDYVGKKEIEGTARKN